MFPFLWFSPFMALFLQYPKHKATAKAHTPKLWKTDFKALCMVVEAEKPTTFFVT